MKRLACLIAAGLLGMALLAAAADWSPGSGIQLSFQPDQWPALLPSLLSARPDKSPYRLTKRTFSYDYGILLVTPFSSAAARARDLSRKGGPVSFDMVAKELSGTRLVMHLRTLNRSKEKAEAVTAALRADGRTIQPALDKFESSELEKIGMTSDPYYVVERSFYFDLSELAGSRSLAVVIFEAGSDEILLPVDLNRLR